MRHFRDAAGQRWDATVGKQSWGALVILFAPRDAGEVRTTMMAAETMLDAERELAALTEDELRERLEASEPWG